jgi:nucleotide-binding universal stress UspA family protein
MDRDVIVVGWTPNAEGEAAIDAAVAEAGRHDAVLHVVNASNGRSHADAKSASDEQLDALRDRLSGQGVEHEVEQTVGTFDPAEAILDAADRHSAALVVLGLRRRTPVGKLLMGSTAQRVLLQSKCPVLAVKS